SNDEPQPSSDAGKKDDEGVSQESGIDDQERPKNSTQDVNAAGPITTAPLEATHADFFGDETKLDMSNITTTYLVPSTPNTIIHKDHSLGHVIGDVQFGIQTRRMTKTSNEQGFISAVYEGKTHEDLHTCLFACFLSQVEPKKVIQALTDLSWIEAMQDELLQNKKDKRGIVIRNKARLVAQGYTQEEGIDYDEVFAPVARIEAIRLFLAYASLKDFVVYQMDGSAFLYGKIEEEVYVFQPPGFEDPEFPDRVYKVEKALYGLHQDSKAWYETLSTYLSDNEFQRGQIDKTLFIKKVKGDILLVQVYVDDIIFGSTRNEMCTEFEKMMHNKFQMSSMGELTFFLGLQVTQKDDGIFISQDKYVDEIFKKFGFSTMKTTITPMETSKPLTKDENSKDVDVHLYRSIIGSLMYLTSSRPDIIFADSPFDLEAYTDSDYAGASLDRKSTTGAEYVAAASCCGQVLWIQNQMLDYGYNFMNTKIFIDNESTICIVKNPGFYSKTKHIEIRHHFIRDSNEKKLIQMIKIHTDQNIADFLTKAFDVVANDEIQVSAVGRTYYGQGEGTTVPVGSYHTPTGAPSTSQPHLSPTLRSSIRQETKVPQLGSPPHTNVADEAASTGVDVRLGGATTTGIGLEAGQGSGNIDKTPTMPHDSPLLRVNTLGSDEGNLKQTKQIYGTAFTKLIKKVKKLEKTIKTSQDRRKAKIVVSNDEEDLEDPSKQGRKIVEIDQDPDISLVQHDVEVQGRHEHDMESDFEFTAAEEVYTSKKGVSTASASSTKDKALRLQEQLDKEERQRIARAHEAASSFNIEEWEDIQARIEADEELAQRLQAEEREKYSEAKKARLLAELINQRKRHFAQ
ncbi:putative ribonuclease H-like domain-containing protein, partial [Tanacetum coccineum]